MRRGTPPSAGPLPSAVIDTHCHLTSLVFRGREREVADAAEAAGVRAMVSVSVGSDDAAAALDLARRDPRIWCTAGVHPLHSDEAIDWALLAEVGTDPRCVAWGELGLDRHYARPPLDLQARVLETHLEFIRERSAAGWAKPVIVHSRKAVRELLPRLAESGLPPERFVFHCFTEGPKEAREVLDFGASISFTGVLTFRNAPAVAEAARLVPLDRAMVETDSPYLAPEPHRTLRPNEPRLVGFVAARLAEIHGLPPAEIEAILDANAIRFFGLPIEPPALR
jgi:TatD DNase family protein